MPIHIPPVTRREFLRRSILAGAGLLTIPAGANVIRLLPALNLSQGEAEEGLKIIESVAAKLAG